MPASRQTAAVPNALDPEQMPAADRIREIAYLLAIGFLRQWARRTSRDAKKGLAIRATPSDSCVEPTSEGETA
jgi:hypothetical protein